MGSGQLQALRCCVGAGIPADEYHGRLRAGLRPKPHRGEHAAHAYSAPCAQTLCLLKALQRFFNSAEGWNVNANTVVDDNSICAANRGHLQAFELSEADQVWPSDVVDSSPPHAIADWQQAFSEGVTKLWFQKQAQVC